MKPSRILLVLPCLWATSALHADRAPAPNAVHAPAAGSCVDADRDIPEGDPGPCIRKILDVLNKNKGKKISEILPLLDLGRSLVIGANHSNSLQRSRQRDNPRLYFRVPCGYLTVNLTGDSVEISIKRQTADPRVQPPGAKKPGAFSVGGGTGVFNPVAEGEMLLDLHLPSAHDLTAADIFNRYNPEFPIDGMEREVKSEGGKRKIRMETKSCTGCHVDTAGGITPEGKTVAPTGGALGVRKVKVGEEEIFAIVSPQDRVRGERADGELYCVPSDLRFQYDCSCAEDETKRNAPLCQKMRAEKGDYQPWSAQTRSEACARLRWVLQQQPRSNCNYDPRRNPKPEERGCYADQLKQGS